MKLDTQANSLTFNRLDPWLSADSTTYQFINPFTMDENDDDFVIWLQVTNFGEIIIYLQYYNDDHTRNDIGWSTLY